MEIRRRIVDPASSMDMTSLVVVAGASLLGLCVFFFIAFMNLMGLAPGSATPTANVWVTAALASTTLALMIGGGMIVQGPLAYWKNLVPHVPPVLVPLLFVV